MPIEFILVLLVPHAPKTMILTKQYNGLGEGSVAGSDKKNALGDLVLFYGMQLIVLNPEVGI